MQRLFMFSLFITTLFTGCTKNSMPSWAIGNWEFDPVRTELTFKKVYPANWEASFPTKHPLLVDLNMNTEYDISTNSIIISFPEKKIIIDAFIFSKNDKVCTIKGPVGKPIEIHKTASGIWIGQPDEKRKSYFKRKSA